MNAQKLRFCPCSSLDAKNAEIERYYMSEIDLFSSDLSINNETPADDLIYFRDYRVFRNVKLFIQRIKQVGAKDGVSVQWILSFCLYGAALRWFNSNSYEVKAFIISGPLRSFFEQLMSQFDDETRIEKKQKEARLTIFACRRCSAKFPSNIKLHQHVQNHHQKKTEKSASEIAKSTSSESAIITSSEIVISTFLFTSTAKPVTISIAELTFSATSSSSSEPASVLTSSISQSESIFDISLSLDSSVTSISTSEGALSSSATSTPIATSRKQIFWAEIVSRSVIASKTSRLSISTSRSVSVCTETASNICSSTSPQTFSRNSASKHQKFYLTIEDLFEMFDGKLKRMNLLHIKQHIKKIEFFPKIFYQSKITSYFSSAANQSKTISQSSKTSNSRSFHQHMLAEAIRNTLSKWSEKSIILSYKTSTFSHRPSTPSVSEISNVSSYKLTRIFRCKFVICPSFSSAFNVIFVFSHVCRICSDTFGSNNDLHRHLRAIHFCQASRHDSEKLRAPGRNTMTWRFLICWRRNRSFSYFFSCITIRFLEEWIACSRHVTQRKRCDFLSLMTSVTINLHIELKSEYLDKNGLASWQSGPYLALCLLDSNNSITLFITLLFNTFYRNSRKNNKNRFIIAIVLRFRKLRRC